MGEMVIDGMDDPRLTAVGLLVEVYEGLVEHLGELHARHGLSGSEFDSLLRLARSGERLQMSDLAAQTSMSTSGITRVVDRLEQRGLVRREPSPADRRVSLVVLTDEGVGLLRRELPDLLELIERWFTGPITAEQLESMMAALRVARDQLRPAAVANTEQ